MAILQTLQRTNWNKQEAAQILGLYRPTLYSKMKKHEIQDGGKGAAAARGAGRPVASYVRPTSRSRQPQTAQAPCRAAPECCDRVDDLARSAVGDVVALRASRRLARAVRPAVRVPRDPPPALRARLALGAADRRLRPRGRRRAVDAHARVARALRRRVDDSRRAWPSRWCARRGRSPRRCCCRAASAPASAPSSARCASPSRSTRSRPPRSTRSATSSSRASSPASSRCRS